MWSMNIYFSAWNANLGYSIWKLLHSRVATVVESRWVENRRDLAAELQHKKNRKVNTQKFSKEHKELVDNAEG